MYIHHCNLEKKVWLSSFVKRGPNYVAVESIPVRDPETITKGESWMTDNLLCSFAPKPFKIGNELRSFTNTAWAKNVWFQSDSSCLWLLGTVLPQSLLWPHFILYIPKWNQTFPRESGPKLAQSFKNEPALSYQAKLSKNEASYSSVFHWLHFQLLPFCI